MRINRNKASHKPPYIIMILDAFDANFYADTIAAKENEIVARIDTYELAKTLADAVFVSKNFMWESLEEMNDLDAGYDVRVYDANQKCVYAAHEKFKQKWIPSAHALNYEFWHVG